MKGKQDSKFLDITLVQSLAYPPYNPSRFRQTEQAAAFTHLGRLSCICPSLLNDGITSYRRTGFEIPGLLSQTMLPDLFVRAKKRENEFLNIVKHMDLVAQLLQVDVSSDESSSLCVGDLVSRPSRTLGNNKRTRRKRNVDGVDRFFDRCWDPWSLDRSGCEIRKESTDRDRNIVRQSAPLPIIMNSPQKNDLASQEAAPAARDSSVSDQIRLLCSRNSFGQSSLQRCLAGIEYLALGCYRKDNSGFALSSCSESPEASKPGKKRGESNPNNYGFFPFLPAK